MKEEKRMIQRNLLLD
jgi:hypothetical protein